MNAPRRYRWAVRAYPAAYRRLRGDELLTTLSDRDEDRGGPSSREAMALAYRGAAMRAGLLASADGMLRAAAVVLLVAVTGGFTWAERLYIYDGEVAAMGTDGPTLWLVLALAATALLVLAAGPPGEPLTRRRRTATILLAGPLSLAVFTTPGQVFHVAATDAAMVADYLRWLPAAVYANWQLTVPAFLGSMLGVALALELLGRLRAPSRQRVLAAALIAIGTATALEAWRRPDLPAEYGRSALADLGAATFVAAAGVLIALAAAWRGRTRPLDTR